MVMVLATVRVVLVMVIVVVLWHGDSRICAVVFVVIQEGRKYRQS